MQAYERRIHIINRIAKMKIVHVYSLAKELEVSEMTIRRDLKILEEEGMIVRTHGGALINKGFSPIFDFNLKSYQDIDDKLVIAEYAASLIKEGDTVAINTSTITANIAQFVLDKKITVITNSLEVMDKLSLSKSVTLISTGGTFIQKYRSFEGGSTINTFAAYNYDIGFVGTNGIQDMNIYTGASLEAGSKIEIIENSKKAYVLAEAGKFDVKGQIKIARFEDVEAIITTNVTDNIKGISNKVLDVKQKEL